MDFRGLLKLAGVEKTPKSKNALPIKFEEPAIASRKNKNGIFLPAVQTYSAYTLKDHILSALTGMERLKHATPEENVQGILDNGLLTSKSLAPDTYTSKVKGSNEISKNRVFLARWNTVAKGVANKQKGFGQKSKILDFRIPYDELRDLGYTKYNPEYVDLVKTLSEIGEKRNLARGNTIAAILAGPGIGTWGTRVFRRDIPPEYIVGSGRFRNGALKTLKNFPKYVLKHPTRFAAGSAGAALGTKALVDLVKNIYGKIDSKRRQR